MQKIPNNHYFIAWADYEGGTCTRCNWGPNDHGHDSERGKDYCVFEPNDGKNAFDTLKDLLSLDED